MLRPPTDKTGRLRRRFKHPVATRPAINRARGDTINPMGTAIIQFHGSLNDFLAAARRCRSLEVEFEAGPGVKGAIEALGVPHPEVDRIVLNGRSVGFEARLEPGDRVEVFGLQSPPAPDSPLGLIPALPQPPRFILDGHLGRLARYMRMLGFDCRYDRNMADPGLARISAAEERLLLTRDRGLLRRSIVRLGHLVRDDDPRRQLAEVVARYRLAPLAKPFSRCIRCNGEIAMVDRSAVLEALADRPRTLRFFDSFGRCGGCGAIYWQGSHFDRMSRLVQEVVREAASFGDNSSAEQLEDGE